MNEFDYDYSAPTESERMEIEAMRREYSPENKKEDALSRIRALDRKVRLPAEITGYVLGVIATLVLGIGMCMSLEAIPGGMILGVVIGVAGIVLLAFNYKIYKLILKSRKNKYGKEIVELTEKLLKDVK